MIRKITPTNLKNDQMGMASILITMIMMIVISLIVLGFSQVSRNEQQSSLDHQLSSQAFYAAESGVNDAIGAINNGYLTTHATGKTSCAPDAAAPLNAASTSINPSGPIDYTCLLINPQPPSLQFSNVGFDSPVVVPVETSASAAYINLSWQDSSGSSGIFAGCRTNFPTSAVWTASNCGASVLRVDIIAAAALGTGTSRANLQADTQTFYLVPHTGGTFSVTYTYPVLGPQQAQVDQVKCQSPPIPPNVYDCNVQITGPGGVLGTGLHFLRLQSLYGNQEVNISGYQVGGFAVQFIGGQASIDSTGQANNILRRIQVRVPLNAVTTNPTPFAVQSTSSVCKRFTTIGPADTNHPSLSLPVFPGPADTGSCFGS